MLLLQHQPIINKNRCQLLLVSSSSNSGHNIDGLPSIASVSCTGDEEYFTGSMLLCAWDHLF